MEAAGQAAEAVDAVLLPHPGAVDGRAAARAGLVAGSHDLSVVWLLDCCWVRTVVVVDLGSGAVVVGCWYGGEVGAVCGGESAGGGWSEGGGAAGTELEVVENVDVVVAGAAGASFSRCRESSSGDAV